MLTGAQHLQNIHPLVVHFPIGLLMGAVLLYFMAWILKKEDLVKAGFWVLLLGTLFLIVAVGTGLYAEQGVMVHLSVREKLLSPHKQYMIVTFIVCFITSVWAVIARPFPTKGRILFLFLLLIIVGTMTIGADLGGRLVYDYNAGGDACRQPIQFTK